MTAIDQQTRRMARTGLTALDEALACPGYTLYAPLFGPGTVYLLDLHGQEVHRWQLPYPPGLYGYLLPNGHLFYMGKVRDETWERFPSWQRSKGGALLRGRRGAVTPARKNVRGEEKERYLAHSNAKTAH
jgi:hypothetical protein